MISKIYELTVFLTKMLVQENVTTLCCHLYGTAIETYLHIEEENPY